MTAPRAARDGVPGPGRVPAPEPLPAAALDAHCHLDLIEEPAGEVLAAARAAGITRVITVGVDLPSSRWSADRADPGLGVYAAVAVHPNETAAAASSSAHRDEVLAEIAKHAGKALMIHDRDAHEDVLAILAADGAPERVVFHCFSGDAAMAKRCADAGYVMSFAGNLTFANAPALREAAAAAPADLLLVETDAPFLTPVPHRGKPNTPAMVAHTVRCLAGLKRLGVADMCARLTATGERMFGPW